MQSNQISVTNDKLAGEPNNPPETGRQRALTALFDQIEKELRGLSFGSQELACQVLCRYQIQKGLMKSSVAKSVDRAAKAPLKEALDKIIELQQAVAAIRALIIETGETILKSRSESRSVSLRYMFKKRDWTSDVEDSSQLPIYKQALAMFNLLEKFLTDEHKRIRRQLQFRKAFWKKYPESGLRIGDVTCLLTGLFHQAGLKQYRSHLRIKRIYSKLGITKVKIDRDKRYSPALDKQIRELPVKSKRRIDRMIAKAGL